MRSGRGKPGRSQPCIRDDVRHPVLQMNLPDCYLLHLLQEQFGPVIGASLMAPLQVIGRNMIGCIEMDPPGATMDTPAHAVDVAGLLQGDNPEDVFLPSWFAAMSPVDEYETNWERIAKAVRDHVPGTSRPGGLREMATMLLLTNVLCNANCHAKNESPPFHPPGRYLPGTGVIHVHNRRCAGLRQKSAAHSSRARRSGSRQESAELPDHVLSGCRRGTRWKSSIERLRPWPKWARKSAKQRMEIRDS